MTKSITALEKLESLLLEIKHSDEASTGDCWMFAWTYETDMKLVQDYKSVYLDDRALEAFISQIGDAFVRGADEFGTAVLKLEQHPKYSKAMQHLPTLFYRFTGLEDRRIKTAVTKTLTKVTAEIGKKIAVFVKQFEVRYECDLGLGDLAEAGNICSLRELINEFNELNERAPGKVASLRERIKLEAEIKPEGKQRQWRQI